MTTNILPELMRDAAASVRRAANRLAAEEVRAEDVAALVRGCRYVLREVQRMHRATEALACKGSEAQAFRARCEPEIAALDEASAAAAHVRGLADRVPQSKRRDAALEQLDAAEKGLAAVHRAYDEYMEVLNRPPRPIDWKKVEESRAAYERGDYESTDAIMARIQRGEEP